VGRRVALLIATYQYQDEGLRQLTAPAHDAEALAAVLRDPDVAGFDVTTLINEPHHRVGEAVGEFYRDRRRDDLTLLYFSGHGLKDEDGRLYLAMANTKRDSLLFTSLAAEQIDYAMSGCMSRQKVLILDCCYSGAFPAGRIAKSDDTVHALERFQGKGRTVLTASDATQYSFEGNTLHGRATQSVFTRYLVAGLQDGSADLDGDGDITIDELYSYVHDRVVAEMPQQRPKKQDNVEGRTVLARNVNWSMPAYLKHAVTSPIASDRLGALTGLDHLYKIGNENVRAAAMAEVQRLINDDSKAVSAAASALLRVTQSPPDPEPVEPPVRHEPVPVPVVHIPNPVVPEQNGRPRSRAIWIAAVATAAIAVFLVLGFTVFWNGPGTESGSNSGDATAIAQKFVDALNNNDLYAAVALECEADRSAMRNSMSAATSEAAPPKAAPPKAATRKAAVGSVDVDSSGTRATLTLNIDGITTESAGHETVSMIVEAGEWRICPSDPGVQPTG
jgi:caspase domain-containing protein